MFNFLDALWWITKYAVPILNWSLVKLHWVHKLYSTFTEHSVASCCTRDAYTVCNWTRNLRRNIWECVPTKRIREANYALSKALYHQVHRTIQQNTVKCSSQTKHTFKVGSLTKHCYVFQILHPYSMQKFNILSITCLPGGWWWGKISSRLFNQRQSWAICRVTFDFHWHLQVIILFIFILTSNLAAFFWYFLVKPLVLLLFLPFFHSFSPDSLFVSNFCISGSEFQSCHWHLSIDPPSLQVSNSMY